MDTIISEKEVEDIFDNCDKIIKEDIKWIQKNDKKYTIEFNVPIEVNYPGKFVLIGTYNYSLNRFTFTILYNNEFRIKALDIGKGHKNPDKKRIGKKHKHKWTDKYKDKWAYEPNDITTGASIEQIFYEFLKECNIIYTGNKFTIPPYQLEMDGL